jgi:hypothetical protein
MLTGEIRSRPHRAAITMRDQSRSVWTRLPTTLISLSHESKSAARIHEKKRAISDIANGMIVMTRTRSLSGPLALFRHRVRVPVSIALTARHHRIVNEGSKRTGLSRADFIGLLIEEHGEQVEIPHDLAPPDTNDA